jgi:hypothetical protein
LNINEWRLEPQEQEGKYTFSGRIFMTRNIADTLTPEEHYFIISRVRSRVIKNNGADYLQVFTHPTKPKVYVIDNLDEKMKQGRSEEFLSENDYCTILFASEY